jgi:hypothetical protein
VSGPPCAELLPDYVGMPPIIKTLTDRAMELLLRGIESYVDPGAGHMPTRSDGRDLVPGLLLDALRQLTVDNERLPRDEKQRAARRLCTTA